MAFVVTEDCIRCKHTDCVEVCPVNCFYEGANMLVIHPDECISCGACEPVCPEEAILPDSEPRAQHWLALNEEFAKKWPNILEKKESLSEAKSFSKVKEKYKLYFDPSSGTD